MGKKKKAIVGALVLTLSVGTGAGYQVYTNVQASSSGTASVAGMKTATVKLGDVSVDINEDGTVTAGTVDQVLDLAEAAGSTSDTADSSSEENTSGTAQSGEADVAAESSVKTTSADGGDAAGGAQAGGASGSGAGAGGASDAGSASVGAAMSSSGNAGSASMSGSTSTESSGTETSLQVEEVYVAAGQNISEGDQILKVSEDSLATYRAELEAAVSSAELTVKQEEINVETKKAEADYTHDMYIANGESAQETYDATIANLQATVDNLEEEIEDAQDDVDTYQSYMDSGYDYDDELEDAQETLEDLEDQLTIAKNNQTTKSIEAKETLESALTNYNYADQLYEIDTNGLEDDLNTAKDALAEAQEALENFDANMGDGVIYAQYSGMVQSVAYAAGDYLSNEAAIVTFADNSNVTIAVSVTQEDVTNISVGDTADITLDAYSGKTFEGTVSNIETATSRGSSTVSYTVTVTFSGDVSGIYTGMTGAVSFPIQGEEDVLYVPNSAVYQQDADSYVDVLNDDGNVVSTRVVTGFSDGTYVAVESGLSEGQKVVV